MKSCGLGRTRWPAPDPLTFHRLLQELGDLLRVLGVQGGGEDKLALCLHEVLPEKLPASGKRLTHQGLAGGEGRKGAGRDREEGTSLWRRRSPSLGETGHPCVSSHHLAPDGTPHQEGPGLHEGCERRKDRFQGQVESSEGAGGWSRLLLSWLRFLVQHGLNRAGKKPTTTGV